MSAAQETAPEASTPVVNTSVQFTSLRSSWSQPTLPYAVSPSSVAEPVRASESASPYLVDPLLYVVISMLRALQKWYWKSPDRVMAFCERVHAFDGDRAIGSASSCALYLREVGLTLGPTGLVSGTAGVSFRIQSVDKTELVRSLHYVWTCRIMPGVGSRKGIPTQVPFDLQTTREAFRALPRHVQKSAVMNITGVAVSGARKFHQWGPQWADQYCVLCQCQDTTQHRVFECPIGDECRSGHSETVTWLRDQRPEWTHLAVAHQCPAEPILRAVFQGRELPTLDPPPCCDVECWTFYTDGTCQTPDVQPASRAAWGVIQDAPLAREMGLQCAIHPRWFVVCCVRTMPRTSVTATG